MSLHPRGTAVPTPCPTSRGRDGRPPCPSCARLAGRCCGCAGRLRTSWRRSSSNSSCRWRGTSSSRSSCWLRWACLAVPAVGSPVLPALLFSASLEGRGVSACVAETRFQARLLFGGFFSSCCQLSGFFFFLILPNALLSPPLLCLAKCHGLHSGFIFPQLYGSDTGRGEPGQAELWGFQALQSPWHTLSVHDELCCCAGTCWQPFSAFSRPSWRRRPY